MPAILAMGITSLRLMPQDVDMVAVASIFRDLADGKRDAGDASERLHALCGDVRFSNGFFHKVPGRHHVPVHAGGVTIQ